MLQGGILGGGVEIKLALILHYCMGLDPNNPQRIVFCLLLAAPPQLLLRMWVPNEMEGGT